MQCSFLNLPSKRKLESYMSAEIILISSQSETSSNENIMSIIINYGSLPYLSYHSGFAHQFFERLQNNPENKITAARIPNAIPATIITPLKIILSSQTCLDSNYWAYLARYFYNVCINSVSIRFRNLSIR